MIRVYQIQISEAKRFEVNARGWDGVTWGKAYFNATFNGNESGVIDLIENHSDMIEHTMTIDTDDLDETFDIGNCMGDMDKIVWEARENGRSAHKSISVGDIIRKANGEAYIVAQFGFEKIALNTLRLLEKAVAIHSEI